MQVRLQLNTLTQSLYSERGAIFLLLWIFLLTNMVVRMLGFSGEEVQSLIATWSVCVERQLWWEGKWLQLPGPWITELAVSFEVTQPKCHLLKSHVSIYVRGSSSLGKCVVWCGLGVISVPYSSSLSNTYISIQPPALCFLSSFSCR